MKAYGRGHRRARKRTHGDSFASISVSLPMSVIRRLDDRADSEDKSRSLMLQELLRQVLSKAHRDGRPRKHLGRRGGA